MQQAAYISLTNLNPVSEPLLRRDLFAAIDRLPATEESEKDRLKREMNTIDDLSKSKEKESENHVPSQFRVNGYKEIFSKIKQLAVKTNIEIPEELSMAINGLDTLKEEPQTSTSETLKTDKNKANADSNKDGKNKSLFDQITRVMSIGLPLGGLLYGYLQDEKHKKDSQEAMNKFDEEINNLQNSDKTPENQSRLKELISNRNKHAQNMLLEEAMNLTKKHFKQIEQQRRAVSNQSGINLGNLSQLFTGNAARDPRYNQQDLEHLLNLQSHRFNKLI